MKRERGAIAGCGWTARSVADGVALAAIQGLHQVVKDEGGRMKDEVEAMKRENLELRKRLAELEQVVQRITKGSNQ